MTECDPGPMSPLSWEQSAGNIVTRIFRWPHTVTGLFISYVVQGWISSPVDAHLGGTGHISRMVAGQDGRLARLDDRSQHLHRVQLGA